jgi:hypothetical protein
VFLRGEEGTVFAIGDCERNWSDEMLRENGLENCLVHHGDSIAVNIREARSGCSFYVPTITFLYALG